MGNRKGLCDQAEAGNIADLTGLSAAYDAYRASVAAKCGPVQNGFSGNQQFFLSYAQYWASKVTEALRSHACSICGEAHRPLVIALNRVQYFVMTRLDGRRDVAQQEAVHVRVPGKLADGAWRGMQRV